MPVFSLQILFYKLMSLKYLMTDLLNDSYSGNINVSFMKLI
jgi:hypothetical protein